MSSVLFGLQIAAFVLVIYWAYTNDLVRPSTGEKGLLRMVSVAPVVQAAAQKAPRWRRAPQGRPTQRNWRPQAKPTLWRPEPKWKRRTAQR